MPKVTIIVNAQVQGGKISTTAPVAERMALALSKSVINSRDSYEIEILSGADLWSKSPQSPEFSQDSTIYCPLTIKLPDWFNFSGRKVYDACRNLERRRKWVKQNFGYKTSYDNIWLGDLWLPIIYANGESTFGSVICEGMMPNQYHQPFDLPLEIRPQLKKLASELLDSIQAIPSVYLLQFKLVKNEIIFDRLWPFPATPAIASINNPHQPNLYSCHWLCLSNQPLKLKAKNS